MLAACALHLLYQSAAGDITVHLKGRFGHQKVVVHTSQELGTGSYGSVVKATLDGVPSAAKIIHRIFIKSDDPGLTNFVARFEQECEILRSLKHPCIVQFLGVVQDPSTEKPILLIGADEREFDKVSGELTDRHTLPRASEYLPRHCSSGSSPAQEWNPPPRPVQQQHLIE